MLAQRTLLWDGKRVELSIHTPRRNADGDWSCEVQIDLVPGGQAYQRKMPGIDSWQCIELAIIELQHVVMERYPDVYQFNRGDEGGFSFVTPIGLPDQYAARLRRHLAAERERMSAALWEEALQGKRWGQTEDEPPDGDQT